jgi:hypothetical protein
VPAGMSIRSDDMSLKTRCRRRCHGRMGGGNDAEFGIESDEGFVAGVDRVYGGGGTDSGERGLRVRSLIRGDGRVRHGR